MKVAQLLYSGLGGHGSVVFPMLDADKDGEWHSILGFVGIEPLLQAYAHMCSERNIAFEYFPSTPNKPWLNWGKILSWLNDNKPDVILLHSMTYLLPCLWYVRLNGCKLVVVEHQAISLKRPIEFVFTYFSMMLADWVVLLTTSYACELKLKMGLFFRSAKVKIIPNGIDPTRFRPFPKSEKIGNPIQLGMAGRFTSSKRQDVLVAMMSHLRHSVSSVDWRLSLAGDGERMEVLQKMVLTQRQEDFITLTGQLDESQMITWYQSLDYYVHATEAETLSTALLQAMATGLPIIASDVPGISNLLKGDEGQLGFLIKQNTPEAFAYGVVSLHSDPLLQVKLGKATRLCVEQSYTQRKMFESYKELIKGGRN